MNHFRKRLIGFLLMITFGLLLPGCTNKYLLTGAPISTQPNTIDTSMDSSVSSMNDLEKVYTIISGKNPIEEQPIMSAPFPGHVLVNKSINTYLSFYKGNDRFYVLIYIDFFLNESFTYQNKSMVEWLSDPIITFRESVYAKWYQNMYLPYDEKMRAAEARGEDYAQGWEKHDIAKLFDEYWRETQSDEVQTAYQSAMKYLKAARDAYDLWQLSSARNDCNELLNNEYHRLRDLGLDVRTEQDTQYSRGSEQWGILVGYLTADQIDAFPANINYYFEINWAE
jgi:hypothetical protein